MTGRVAIPHRIRHSSEYDYLSENQDRCQAALRPLGGGWIVGRTIWRAGNDGGFARLCRDG